MNKFFTILTLLPFGAFAQSYAPAAGQVGSTAIHKDSSFFIGWATGCVVERGYMNIEDQSLGYASFGTTTEALGVASGVSTSTVSLGDNGTATLTFDIPIGNGTGPDFVVFENGVTDNFLELGFVEVSSDGANFVRFPAISEIQTATQIGGFGNVDCRYIHNFAGKYRVGFGTPFDLEDLVGSPNLDLDNITHVRIIDVVGSIDPAFGTYDSQGTIVNNLHPTPFESSGFDLDAVGIIHTSQEAGIEKLHHQLVAYPNPTKGNLQINVQVSDDFWVTNTYGQTVISGTLIVGANQLDVSSLPAGIYFVQTLQGKTLKVIKE